MTISYLNFQRLWILCRTWVLSTCKNLYILKQSASELSIRKHSLNSKHQRIFRMTFNCLCKIVRLHTANETCMMMIHLVSFFSS